MGISSSDLPRGGRRRLALTVWSSAEQTDRQGGWERLVCRLVWTARLRYQVAVGWCCWGWRTVLHTVRGSALAPPCRRLWTWHPGKLLHSCYSCVSPVVYLLGKTGNLSSLGTQSSLSTLNAGCACMLFHAKHPTAHVKCCKAGDKGRRTEVLIISENIMTIQ